MDNVPTKLNYDYEGSPIANENFWKEAVCRERLIVPAVLWRDWNVADLASHFLSWTSSSPPD